MTTLNGFVAFHCNPVTNSSCGGGSQVDDSYFEIRQTLYEVSYTPLETHTPVAYNAQRWHGDTGPIGANIFARSICGHPGAFINIEIYEIKAFGVLDRRTSSFRVNETDNGAVLPVPMTDGGGANLSYSWTC